MAQAPALQCTIFIGRDENTSRLGAFLSPQKGKLLDQIAPNTVSRYKPKEQTAHCKLEIYKDGQLKLINLNPQNVTYVDGMQIERAWITADSRVELGYSRFYFSLANMLADFGYKKPFHIDHLQGIHQQYQDMLEELQLKQAKEQSKQRLQGICSMLGLALVALPFDKLGLTGDSVNIVRGICVAAALILSVYFFLKSRNPENTFVMRKKKIDNWLRENYRCPNPECGVPFKPGQDYLTLKSMGQCPICKCKLVETAAYVNHHQPSSAYNSYNPGNVGYSYGG